MKVRQDDFPGFSITTGLITVSSDMGRESLMAALSRKSPHNPQMCKLLRGHSKQHCLCPSSHEVGIEESKLLGQYCPVVTDKEKWKTHSQKRRIQECHLEHTPKGTNCAQPKLVT